MKNLRNVCIVAHVDHGKTSIADSLLSHGGIISQGLAGSMLYLDSRNDERSRGITMKSSVISINHKYKNRLKTDDESQIYFINLLDSPGHVDFSCEVSLAVKLSDNAIIVVDAVEGVCSQTRVVLKQTWKERMNYILVINKIDKLHTDLKLSTSDAYQKITEIIESIDHIFGELISADVAELEDTNDEFVTKEYIKENYDTTLFHPLKGRVIFASAYHHWGFRISDFVNVYANTLNLDKNLLYSKMWGDYYLNSKKQFVKGAIKANKKNVFTSLILDPIWQLYDLLEMNDIEAVTNKMTKLNISVKLNRVGSRESIIQNRRNVFNSWLPLGQCILDTLVEKCPNPQEAITNKKIESIIPDNRFLKSRALFDNKENTESMVAYIGKMMINPSSDKSLNSLVGLSRVFLGKVVREMRVFVFTAKFNPYKVKKEYLEMTPVDFPCNGPMNIYEYEDGENRSAEDETNFYILTITDLKQFSGTYMETIKKSAPAGFIVGLGFSECGNFKNATVTSNCTIEQSLGMFNQSHFIKLLDYTDFESESALYCVALEPTDICLNDQFGNALLYLEQSELGVSHSIDQKGQYLLHVAGEVHLEKCLTDLREVIAPGLEFTVSDPIVQFRETIVGITPNKLVLSCIMAELLLDYVPDDVIISQIELNDTSKAQGVVTFIRIPAKFDTVRLLARIRMFHMPEALKQWVLDNSQSYKRFQKLRFKRNYNRNDMRELQKQLSATFQDALVKATEENHEIYGMENSLNYSDMLQQFWGLSSENSDRCNMMFSKLGGDMYALKSVPDNNVEENLTCNSALFKSSVFRGFQQAMKNGPICGEPITGCVCVLEEVWQETTSLSNDVTIFKLNLDCINEVLESTTDSPQMIFNIGQLRNLVTKGISSAMLCHPGIRLMTCHYQLNIEVRKDSYKNFKALLNQLQGRVVDFIPTAGSFEVEALLPVINSFTFGKRLREVTSGDIGQPNFRNIIWQELDCHPLLDVNYYRELNDGLGLSTTCIQNNQLKLLRKELKILKLDSNHLLNVLFDGKLSEELVARTQSYIMQLRESKGHNVRKILVEDGDKQRTLAKKK